MRAPERAVFIGSIGGIPKIQERLPEIMLGKGVILDPRPLDYMGTDYQDWLEDTGDYIKRLAKRWRVHVIGASGGGPPAASLFRRHADVIDRAVIWSGKMTDLYAFKNPKNTQRYEGTNLVESAGVFQVEDRPRITPHMLQRMLFTHGEEDGDIAPEHSVLEGAPNTHEFPTITHDAALTYAMATRLGLSVTIDFVRHD